MGKHTDQRDRTLLLTTILQEETDEKHPLSLTQLRERLAEQGAAAERKSIYRDLAALRRHGLDVVFRPGNGGGWYLGRRTFAPGELRAMADAIAVYPHFSQAQREALLDKVKGLTSIHQRPRLHRPVALSRQEDGAVQSVLDRIHTACQEGKALSFVPYRYDRHLEKAPAGARQFVSPKGLLWTDQGYRLLGWDHRTQNLRLFRPDRMGEVLVTGLPAQGPGADPAMWTAAPFGLDPDRRERVQLLCQEALAEEVADRFGPEAQAEPQGTGFLLSADVVVGPAFWEWVDTHSGEVEVVGPTWAARQWRERCCFPPRRAAV
ncbi:MAG: WYL domain-containing protein [Ruminiclostridium sp.]|nr:WYL domain-containing protein [Ruminiclostridium sp.]